MRTTLARWSELHQNDVSVLFEIPGDPVGLQELLDRDSLRRFSPYAGFVQLRWLSGGPTSGVRCIACLLIRLSASSKVNFCVSG